MSWLSDLASKAENFLNNIDSSAADALGPLRTKGLKTDQQDSDYETIDSPHELLCNTTINPSGIPYYVHEDPERPVSRSPSHDKFVKQKPDSRTLGSWEWDTCSHLDETNTMLSGDVIPRIAADISTFGVGDAPANFTLASPPNISSARTQKDGLRFDIGDPHTVIVDSTTPGNIDLAATVHSQASSDLYLENKLLRSELSSLSQEVSDLLKRNIKIADENKDLRSQIDRLRHRLQDSDRRIGELQGTIENLQPPVSSVEITPDEVADLKNQLGLVNSELETTFAKLKKAGGDVDALTAQLQESRHQQELTKKRLQVSLDQTARVTQELAQYKEKATHILAMKDKLIATLREATPTDSQYCSPDGSNDESADALRRQVHLLRTEHEVAREEATRWRHEVDSRDLMLQEMVAQLQAERESSRHSLESAEQHALREKQFREDSDAELIRLRAGYRELEELTSKQKADLHAQLQASESELNRLRHLLSRKQPFSLSDSPEEHPRGSHGGTMLSRTDPEHVLTLESRLRQLTDTLMSRQDALDSVLAQNHALKIRLERAQSDNESLASTLATEGYPLSTEAPLRLPYHIASGYGCARILLRNSVIPRPFHPVVSTLDEVAMRFTNLCRKWPLTRLLFFLYLAVLHLWLLFASFLFLPSPIPRN